MSTARRRHCLSHSTLLLVLLIFLWPASWKTNQCSRIPPLDEENRGVHRELIFVSSVTTHFKRGEPAELIQQGIPELVSATMHGIVVGPHNDSAVEKVSKKHTDDVRPQSVFINKHSLS